MSDPLSVAGTAVGIVSLGIQVCQGLINYIQTAKGRKDEIQDSIQDVQQVVLLIYSLNNTLRSINARRYTESLAASLERCYASLEKLQAFLVKLDPPQQSSGTSRIVRDARHSLVYPFQQAKVNSLHQSLRKDLSDLRLAIQIVSLEFNHNISQDIQLISHEARINSTHQNDCIQNLQTQVQHNSEQLESLKSTIAGVIAGICDQQQETQWLIRDFGQMVDGRLTVIETGVNSIAHNNGVTAAKIEEITQTLVSHSESLSNMGIEISRVRRHAHTGPIAQHQAIDPLTPGSHISDKPGLGISLSSRCNCASILPTSRTSFMLWHLKFELAVQDQHHRGCVLFDIQRNKKRKALARFPYKVAWFSARMALACVEYTTGTSKLGIFVPYKNIVHTDHSPVLQTFDTIWEWDIESRPARRIIQDIESIERQVLSMYRDGTSSPNDRDEDNMNHAEAFFCSLIEIKRGCTLLDRMIKDDRVLLATLQVFQTLLLINHDIDGTLFCQILYEKCTWEPLSLTATEAHNAHHLLSQIAKVANCRPYDISRLIGDRLSDPIQSFIRASEDISPLHKAIMLQSLDDLVAYVSQRPKSLLELLPVARFDSSVKSYTVLHLAIAWPDGLRYLLSTEAKSLLDDSLSPGSYKPPFILAGYSNYIASVNILMEAGCSFELSRRSGNSFSGISEDFMATFAFNLSKRRLQLLEMVQKKLGKFLEGTTVAFADMKAAKICDYLDKANIHIHQSLRVERDYKSIYSCTAVPIYSFYLFWKNGFRHIKSHDNVGLLPPMTYRIYMFQPPNGLELRAFLDAIDWLHEKGFLNQTPTDPLKLGLNLSSTAYHYIGAMFGAFYDAGESQEPKQLPDAWLVINFLSSIKVEDECVCWCNATDHGCSPINLLLKSHLDERQPGIIMDFGLLRHIIFHHRIFNASLSSSAKKPTGFVIELLRLLTFEALEMTHTCCTFDAISEDILEGMVSTASVRPAAIFLCRGKKVRDIRSSPGERSSSHLLEDLMSEFTTQLTQQGLGPGAFEQFIEGYWRRRMSELYDPDPQVMNEMKQHQAFRGFKASAGVEEYVLPKRLSRLLGEDFELVGVDSRAEESASLFETKSSSDTESLSDTESSSDKESSSEIGLFCEYCHMRDTDSDDDQSDDQSDEEMIDESCCGKEGELDVDEDCD